MRSCNVLKLSRSSLIGTMIDTSMSDRLLEVSLARFVRIARFLHRACERTEHVDAAAQQADSQINREPQQRQGQRLPLGQADGGEEQHHGAFPDAHAVEAE